MGFQAKALSRNSIECPKCAREVFITRPPSGIEPSDKSLYICVCGWESKNAI